MSISRSRIVRWITGKIWLAYRLVNHSRREIYFGCTKDFQEGFREHASQDTGVIGHWDFARDNIQEKLVKAGLTQTEASELVHFLEKQPNQEYPRYTVVQTCGI